jgi:hypothetical protein
MQHPEISKRRSMCGRIAFAMFGAVAGLGLAATTTQAEPLVTQAQTISPTGFVQSLDALPQISAEEIAAAAARTPKPFRSAVDANTLAALKAAAKNRRFTTPDGVIPDPVQVGGAGGKQTVNPAELVFSATSNAACGAITGFTVTPADQALAVGDTNVGVLQGVNICLSVYDKTGALQSGYPKSTGTFFSLGALNNSDPRMIYDWINHRYYFVVISYPNSCGSNCTSAAFYNLAVSTGDSPNGSYCIYGSIPVATTPNPSGGFFFLPDYPRLGQDREAIYIASNLYRPNYVSDEVFALRKSDLMSCSAAMRTNVTGLTNGFTIQPANVFLPSDQPKSMFFVTSMCCGGSSQLVISAFHSPFSSPTFNQITIATSHSYTTPPGATQQGTATLMETNDERISGSPYYAAGSIYAALTTDGGNGEPGNLLFQIQPFTTNDGSANDGKIASARILNEITHYGSGTSAYYFGTQVPDGEGNVTEVFSFSNSANFASLGWLTRRSTQAPGTLPDGGLFTAGSDTYLAGRWGDYWATAPAGIVSGGGTGGFPKFWFAGMIAIPTHNWGTVIGRTGYTTTNED